MEAIGFITVIAIILFARLGVRLLKRYMKIHHIDEKNDLCESISSSM